MWRLKPLTKLPYLMSWDWERVVRNTFKPVVICERNSDKSSPFKMIWGSKEFPSGYWYRQPTFKKKRPFWRSRLHGLWMTWTHCSRLVRLKLFCLFFVCGLFWMSFVRTDCKKQMPSTEDNKEWIWIWTCHSHRAMLSFIWSHLSNHLVS